MSFSCVCSNWGQVLWSSAPYLTSLRLQCAHHTGHYTPLHLLPHPPLPHPSLTHPSLTPPSPTLSLTHPLPHPPSPSPTPSKTSLLSSTACLLLHAFIPYSETTSAETFDMVLELISGVLSIFYMYIHVYTCTMSYQIVQCHIRSCVRV